MDFANLVRHGVEHEPGLCVPGRRARRRLAHVARAEVGEEPAVAEEPAAERLPIGARREAEVDERGRGQPSRAVARERPLVLRVHHVDDPPAGLGRQRAAGAEVGDDEPELRWRAHGRRVAARHRPHVERVAQARPLHAGQAREPRHLGELVAPRRGRPRRPGSRARRRGSARAAPRGSRRARRARRAPRRPAWRRRPRRCRSASAGGARRARPPPGARPARAPPGEPGPHPLRAPGELVRHPPEARELRRLVAEHVLGDGQPAAEEAELGRAGAGIHRST